MKQWMINEMEITQKINFIKPLPDLVQTDL